MKKLWRVLKTIQSINPWALFNTFMTQCLLLMKPYALLFFSAKIVDQLLNHVETPQVLNTLYVFLFVQTLIALLYNYFKMKNDVSMHDVEMRLNDALTLKALTMEYTSLTDPQIRLNFQRAEEGSNFSGGILTFLRFIMATGFGIIMSLLVAGVALVNLSSMQSSQTSNLAIFTNSPLYLLTMIALILVPLVISIQSNKKTAAMNLKNFEMITHTNREFSYYGNTLFSDNAAGKTLRLYHGTPMVMDVFKTSSDDMIDSMINLSYRTLPYKGLSQSVSLLATSLLLLLVGAKASVGVIGIGAVLMYTGYVQTLVQNLVKGLGDLTSAHAIINYLQYYIDFLDIPDSHHDGLMIDPQSQAIITFENVSFHYPNSDINVLKNVSLTLTPQDHIAVVGPNGAGKTSFIQLLCRLYKPSEGRILLNGIDIQEYDLKAYTDILSVVFQDTHLYPFEIVDNITLGSEYNDTRIQEVLEATGIAKKISKLPKGLHTNIKGQLDEGTRLSGGESQKFAISRAWYKDSPIVILDEPTAALDPISEAEIYDNFRTLMGSKTAIYVSHRMSSCKFCDRILVFNHGEVIQDGDHDSLMKDSDKLYAQLFNAQAHYYVQ